MSTDDPKDIAPRLSGGAHGGGAIQEWRDGWPLVAVSALAFCVSTTHLYSIGVFMQSIELDMNWTRAQITSGFVVISIISVILGPFVGALIDRFGPRRIGIPGLAFYCASVMLLGVTDASIAMWWALWVLLGFGQAAIQPAVWSSAVGSRFNLSRGLAFSVMFCGASVGVAIMPLLSESLLGLFGWRTAYAILGGGAALVALPLIFLFFRNRVEQYAREPGSDNRAPAAPPSGIGWRDALRTTRFYRLAAAAFLMMGTITTLAVHFVPILESGGLERSSAVAFAGIIGICSLVGRLGTGVLIDQVDAKIIGAVSAALPAIACLLLLGYQGSSAVGVVIAAIVGLAFGAEISVIAYLTSRYFGLRNYGTLFGTVAGLLHLAGGIGPLIAGSIYDHSDNYHVLFVIAAPIFCVAALLIATLGRYPDFSATKTA